MMRLQIVGGNVNVLEVSSCEVVENVYPIIENEPCSLMHNDTVLVSKRSFQSQGVQNGDVINVIKGIVLNVCVFDPINKQPYNLRFGGESSDVVMTAGLETYFSQLGGNKRVFLCKKYQARQCRAQGKCNSIHADRKKVAVLRQQHPVPESVKKSEVVIDVISPEDGNESFNVPCDRVHKSEGLRVLLEDYQKQCSSSSASTDS
eukprot:gene2664-4143_t